MTNPLLLFSLSQKIVVLTGGLGLLGKQFTHALISAGATVHIIDLENEKDGQQTIKNSFPQHLDQLFYHSGDITNKRTLQKICATIIRKHNRVDVLINNAALNPKVEAGNKATSSSSRFEDLSLDDWNREIAVNLTGTMLCCQVFGSIMKPHSSIINIASIYGLVAPDQSLYPKGFYKPATYGVTKAGVINLTQYLASYWGSQQIRVNCMVLGGVENHQSPTFVKKYASKTPLQRMAHATDFNGILLYLASEASEYSTGGVHVIDGGWTAL